MSNFMSHSVFSQQNAKRNCHCDSFHSHSVFSLILRSDKCHCASFHEFMVWFACFNVFFTVTSLSLWQMSQCDLVDANSGIWPLVTYKILIFCHVMAKKCLHAHIWVKRFLAITQPFLGQLGWKFFRSS